MSCASGGCGIGAGGGASGGCGSGAASGPIEIVGVRLPPTVRTNHYQSGTLRLDLDEHCIVDTERGPAYGIVTQATSASPAYARLGQALRLVLRRANFEDRERYSQAAAREREAFDHCRKRIEELRLPMKLVNAQFSLEDEKGIFFFTAEGRVDFRSLVRDVASHFRVRVEMRQIGVRDAAKMLGGYGDCGRPLCCSTWLKHFDPITIQMAKAQNLSLNPARISGMCGRLKCCLRYEYVPGEKVKKKKGGAPPGERPAGTPEPGLAAPELPADHSSPTTSA